MPPATKIDIEDLTVGQFIFGGQHFAGLENQTIITETTTGKSITYGQLECKTHSLARAMLSLLLMDSNDICGIMSQSSIQYTITISACLILNVTYTSFPPGSGPYNIAQQLIRSKPKCLFISREYYPRLKQVFDDDKYHHLKNDIQIIIMDSDQSDSNIEDCSTFDKLVSAFQETKYRFDSIPYFPKEKNDIVTIVYTSGSTGLPKGACHTHKSIISNCHYLSQYKSIIDHSHLNVLITFPLGHVSGNCVFLLAMTCKTPIFILNYQDINTIHKACHKYRIGQIFGTANVLNVLVKNKSPENDISSVKFAVASGCKLPQSTADILFNQFKINCLDGYGSTEGLYISMSEEYDRIMDHVGKVLPCMEVKIEDIKTKKQLIMPRQVGEICLKGDCLFKEYYKNKEETQKVFDSDGWFHTGDVGFLDEDGNLTITDRIKEIIKCKHYSVFPVEIECFLMTHEDVKSVCVVGVKHRHFNQVARAYVELKDANNGTTSKQLEQFAKDNLAASQNLLGGVVIVNEFRYTSMGKVDRQYFKFLCSEEILDSIDDE